MKLKYIGKADKEGMVTVDVIISKDEKKLIRNYYGRNKCTAKLIQRAIIEACKNYVKKYGKKGSKKKC